MATVKDILQNLCTYLATIPTTRDPTKFWQRYTGAIPFRAAPNTASEFFDLEPKPAVPGHFYGVPGVKEQRMELVLVLAVSPAAADPDREYTAVQDAEYIQDALELGWATTGLEYCQLLETNLDRNNAQRWLVELKFEIIYNTAIVVP